MTLKEILLDNFDLFFSYISQVGLQVGHSEKNVNSKNISHTVLQLPSTCFKVEFNDSFVTITAIK